jgi:hypothetical protein
MQSFEHSTIRKLTPKHFNKFAYSPSEGASWGMLMGWNSAIFQLGGGGGGIIHLQIFNHSSIHSSPQCKIIEIIIVYGPCHGAERHEFVDWLNSLQIEEDNNWMLVGDFNLYRSLENRNRQGGNIQDIMVFNSIISNLGLQEIPLKGTSFTWSNMSLF